MNIERTTYKNLSAPYEVGLSTAAKIITRKAIYDIENGNPAKTGLIDSFTGKTLFLGQHISTSSVIRRAIIKHTEPKHFAVTEQKKTQKDEPVFLFKIPYDHGNGHVEVTQTADFWNCIEPLVHKGTMVKASALSEEDTAKFHAERRAKKAALEANPTKALWNESLSNKELAQLEKWSQEMRIRKQKTKSPHVVSLT